MEVIYCPNCQKRTGFKRSLGVGTIITIFLTAGLWLFVIPVYPARCIVCGTTRGSAWIQSAVNAVGKPGDPHHRGDSIVVAVFVVAVVGWILYAVLR